MMFENNANITIRSCIVIKYGAWNHSMWKTYVDVGASYVVFQMLFWKSLKGNAVFLLLLYYPYL
jgi:hypothetical protein